ncbi:MAG: hypothetical protein SGPRY_011473 [Prymnesium sp.]
MERLGFRGEAVDEKQHFPGPRPRRASRAAQNLAVVLSDPPARPQRETDVRAPLAAEGAQQVAAGGHAADGADETERNV